MTIIKTIAPHLENVLMQNTAQNSQEASFKTSLKFTNRVLSLCPELMDPLSRKLSTEVGGDSGMVDFLETEGVPNLGWRV